MSNVQLFDNFFQSSLTSWGDPYDLKEIPLQHFGECSFKGSSHYSIYEKDGKYIVEVAVPGFSEKDLSATIDKDTRTLKVDAKRAQQAAKEDDEKVVWHHKGQVSHKFQLFIPQKANLESVSASCADGKLAISFMLDEGAHSILNVPIHEIDHKA